MRRVVRALVLCAALLLSLNAAATLEVVYTLRVSYVLCAIAAAVGFPFVVGGWRRLPLEVQVSAAVLVGVYIFAAVLGSAESVAAVNRGGSKRTAVYLLDLAVGLGTLGLVVGAFDDACSLRWLLGAFVLGASLAAGYGILQWPARHYGWAIANVNNSLNPDAVSRGEVFQGTGLLLGWERVRGTFTEPLLFGLYLAASLPLTLTFALRSPAGGIARRVSSFGAGLIVIALVLTSSFPSWAVGAGALMTLGLIYAVRTGEEALAAATASGLTLAVLAAAAVLIGGPSVFAAVTGRDAAEYQTTKGARTRAWSQSVEVWSARPVLGHGPGQSAVRLRYEQSIGKQPSAQGPLVLGSAQGILPASLIDAGVLGLLAWLTFLGCIGVALARGLLGPPSVGQAALAASAVAAAAGAMISGDRLELQVWLLLSVAMAAATASQHRNTPPEDDQ